MLMVAVNNGPVFDQDGASTNSLLDIPMVPRSAVNNRPWNRVGLFKAKGLHVWVEGVDVLCFELAISSQTKCSDRWMDIDVFINGRLALDCEIFSDERRRYFRSHVEVPSVDDRIHHVLL